MISITRTEEGEPLAFDARISEGGSETSHNVTTSWQDYERWASDNCSPEQLVEAAFRFLLDREPKEAILPRFDIAEIARYFPEFETALPRYIGETVRS